MVFFTCNKCGESLKKKDVEKHCNTRCRGPPYLTCIDCLKDFCNEYVKHTICVSEKDRYASQGLKGIPKSKQQLWIESVHDTCSRTIDDGILGITPSIKDLLIWLQEQATIPDKAKTFNNYITNARRGEPKVNIDFVWKILDKARLELQAKMKADREAAEVEKKKARELKFKEKGSSSNSDDSDASDDDSEGIGKNGKDDHQDNEAKVTGKDKKKKRMVSESESVVNGSSEFRKTKKSKKNPKNEETEDSTTLNTALDACHLNVQGIAEEEPQLSKKERKEKKKREKYEAQIKDIESTEAVGESEGQGEPEEESVVEMEGKKGKKKKNKKNVEDSTPSVEEPTDSKEKKKKDKKNKKQTQEEADQENTEISDKKKKNGQLNSGVLNETMEIEQIAFSWDTAILKVLESQDEISLKRLSKKVLNEYLLSLEDDAHIDEVKIMNKFHKKLEKMHNVLVHKDKVRLKTSRD